MAEQYKKTRHRGHCSSNLNCITHCTTFGLSDPHCAQYRSDCSHTDTLDCSNCITIILTLDEISQKIADINDKDIQRETMFGFENASEHIIEWARHNLRASQQDAEKKIIISQMDHDEAFCIFDWGQKILPQKCREAQSTYFGKKDISVLVGSFIWKDMSPSLSAAVTTTTTVACPTYSTQSYIVAITDAAQIELDPLSSSEIITKQFKIDYSHIKRLHKRTDNAGNFSPHSTPEAEKLIWKRVRLCCE